jgi:hypothetical protein
MKGRVCEALLLERTHRAPCVRLGNDQLNHALHMALNSELRRPRATDAPTSTAPRGGQDHPRSAPALKRNLSKAVRRQLIAGGASYRVREHTLETTPRPAGRSHIRATGSSARSLPGPDTDAVHQGDTPPDQSAEQPAQQPF